MDKFEFDKLFSLLHQEYQYELKGLPPNAIIDKKRLWYSEFKNLSTDEFGFLVRNHLRSGKFFPKISDFYDVINELTAPEFDAHDEFEKVIKVIKSGMVEFDEKGVGKAVGLQTALEKKKLNPKTVKIALEIGYNRLNCLESRTWVKKEFLEGIQDEKNSYRTRLAMSGLNAQNQPKIAFTGLLGGVEDVGRIEDV